MSYCYECGIDLAEGEGTTLDLSFWVFPDSSAPEDAVEEIETRPTLLCADCAADFSKE